MPWFYNLATVRLTIYLAICLTTCARIGPHKIHNLLSTEDLTLIKSQMR
jgi:hypothetical protein